MNIHDIFNFYFRQYMYIYIYIYIYINIYINIYIYIYYNSSIYYYSNQMLMVQSWERQIRYVLQKIKKIVNPWVTFLFVFWENDKLHF